MSGSLSGIFSFLPSGSKAQRSANRGRAGVSSETVKAELCTHERLLKKGGLRATSERTALVERAIPTRPQPLPWEEFETQRLEGDGSQRGLGLLLVIGFCGAFWTTVFMAVIR